MYDELIKNLRDYAEVYKLTGNENTLEYPLLIKAADVIEELSKERKKGKWIKCNNHAGYKCSVCKARVSNADVLNGNHNYCYKCGADMRGEG